MIGLNSDEFSIKLQNKARYSFDQRCYALKSLKNVDEIIKCNSYEKIKFKSIRM